eukprot:994710-Pyramimonas_sp.AAC.1
MQRRHSARSSQDSQPATCVRAAALPCDKVNFASRGAELCSSISAQPCSAHALQGRRLDAHSDAHQARATRHL